MCNLSKRFLESANFGLRIAVIISRAKLHGIEKLNSIKNDDDISQVICDQHRYKNDMSSEK